MTAADVFKTRVKNEAFENLASIFFGSLFYSIESSALGYLSINPLDRRVSPSALNLGLAPNLFVEIVNSVIRIMGDKYKHNHAEQFESGNYDSYTSKSS